MLLALSSTLVGSLPTGTFSISPVNVLLAHGQTSTSVNVANAREAPLVIQVQIFRWTQDGDQDVLTPTSDVILSPPMATIPIGGEQTFRLLMRPSSVAEENKERHYRILVAEIPAAGGSPGQLSVAIRASLPMIVTPIQPDRAILAWSAAHGPDNTVVVTVSNTGLAYDKIIALTAQMPDGETVTASQAGTNPYVLPGSKRQWTLDRTATSGTLTLNITTPTGQQNMSLTID